MLSSDVMEAFASVNTALDTVAGLDLTGVGVEELLHVAALTEKTIRRLSVTAHDVSHELEQRSVSEIGGKPTKVLADWLRISPAEARRRARLAEPLAERTALTGESMAARQPATSEAWRAGALDTEHVRIIQRFLDDLPFEVTVAEREKAEAFLAEHARLLRPDQLARLAERLAIELNPDGTFSEADRVRKRGFILGRQRPDGMTEARLCATPELRAYLEALLAKFGAPGMCNPADQTAVTDGEPVEAQIKADKRTVAQRHHDALMAVLRSTLGDPKLGQHNGLPVTVIVTATLQDLQAASGYGLTAGGALIPMADVIRLASHSYHYLTLFDGEIGRALWLGRSKRLASADQRIVLHAKDRGCSAPGCTVPGYGCQVHHAAKDWSDGGSTNIDELAFACECDNQLVETGGWHTRKLPNGDTEWTPPAHLPLIGGTNSYHHPERFLDSRGDPPG